MILSIQLLFKENKRQNNTTPLQRAAKFIDKLKPCKYSFTNRELKKQIFSNFRNTQTK